MVHQPISVKRKIITFSNNKLKERDDEIVTEYPLTIYLNKEEFATMVCTPTHLEEMVIGFLASEGVIRFTKEIVDFSIDVSKGFAYVQLETDSAFDHLQYTKRFIGSCCGKSRQFYFHNDVKTAKTSLSTKTVSANQCIQLMKALQENSFVFKETGGVHNASLCTNEHVVVTRTDIGRHNALDKLYGYSLLQKISIRDKILAFSGRLSSEVLTKAAKIGVGIVLSKAAPTDLAIKLAEDLNITTVGFIRGESFNIYSHANRITL
ncbi:formate dehydrogenase accessory sulfurtransferase FdhD [Alkalihalobacterium bogoriense]|uniref:formate dehydrogenase accessory sulfurtransferase FdhD n=1 Tax=Alkalihalobacterium bogoriense TaxID=246272 RepID=UPI00047BE605|nr:formate dehydrogenase accessory sulfurtransferase FdhD [Alkalihalobacterium bogoriense]